MKKYLLLLFVMAISHFANAQWDQTSGYGPQNQVTCFTVNGSTLYAGTNNGFYYTTDNGATWPGTSTGMTGSNISSLVLNSAKTKIFASFIDDGGVNVTSNGGALWTQIDSNLTVDDVTSLAVIGTTIYAATFGGGVFKSSNNGVSWSPVNTGLSGNDLYVNFLAVNNTNIYAGAGGGDIFVSSNSGASWTPLATGLIGDFVTSIVISGSNIFVGTDEGLLRSVNSGSTWDTVFLGVQYTDVTALSINGNEIYAALAEGGMYESTNDGGIWNDINDGLTNTDIYSMAVCGTNLFAGDDAGAVWIRPLSQLAAVENLSKVNVLSVYPNPVSSRLTLNISGINNDRTQKIIISDLLGQTFSQFAVTESKSEIDVSQLPSGIYFVEVAGEETEWVGKFVKE